MPAFAYAHCASPEQSKPVCGVEPPHLYGLPLYFSASASAASARAPAPPPPPLGAAAAAASTAAAAGAWTTGAAAGASAGVAEQPVGLAEAQRVAAAVLRGGALDVGDPVAELLGIGDRLAARDALLLDRLGLVEEPLDLQLRLVGEARVRALVPGADAHLEEADRVGVAVVEVLHARLDQRGHDRQLLGQAALLGLAAHPRGDLRLRRRVARVAAAAPTADRLRGRVGDAAGRGRLAAEPPRPAGASPPMRMNLTLAMFTSRGTFITASWLLPSSAVNLPPWTLLARKPMCPSEPKSSWWPQS